MKVRLRTVYAGPLGTYCFGDIADLPDHIVKALIKNGYAERITNEIPERKKKVEKRDDLEPEAQEEGLVPYV